MSFYTEKFRIIITIVIGAFIALLMLIGASARQTNFEDLAQGANTKSFFATVNNYFIHCQDIEDAKSCLKGHKMRGSLQSVLWLGNSQLHGINQYQPEQESAPLLLFKKLRIAGFDLLAFSQPNANIQEHYVLFEYLKKRMPVSLLILPVVFDDLRETGLRPSVAMALDDHRTVQSIMRTDIGNYILAEHSEDGSADIAVQDGTIQHKSENKIHTWMEENFDLWKRRPGLRGECFLFLYKLRNFVFNIKATSKRPVIRSRYEKNMKALHAIIDSANMSNTEIILYIPPIRHDVELPYNINDYAKFITEVEALASKKEVGFENLESLVPARLWGMKDSTTLGKGPELDFMHFQTGGHELLANTLHQAVNKKMVSIQR